VKLPPLTACAVCCTRLRELSVIQGYTVATLRLPPRLKAWLTDDPLLLMATITALAVAVLQ
jgi:hypothetical protein